MSLHDDVLAAREQLRSRLSAVLGGPHTLPLLGEALTHPSYGNETGERDNQRLEFLGDSVLGLCVSEILSRRFPDADEGHLSRMRSALVNAQALAEWARRENLGACLALGRGARTKPELLQTNVLADAVEAIVAAVYEATGHDGAFALVEAIVETRLREDAALAVQDPKSALQELVQSFGHETPRYRVAKVDGPQHDAIFTIEVLVGELVLGAGEGKSKRTAERQAAERAMASEALQTLTRQEETEPPTS
jgi:ribonuclease III